MIEIHGRPVKDQLLPMDAVSHGIGYLSEDRKRYGLAVRAERYGELRFSPPYDDYEKGLLSSIRRKWRTSPEKYVDTLKIKDPFGGSASEKSVRRESAESGYCQMADQEQ